MKELVKAELLARYVAADRTGRRAVMEDVEKFAEAAGKVYGGYDSRHRLCVEHRMLTAFVGHATSSPAEVAEALLLLEPLAEGTGYVDEMFSRAMYMASEWLKDDGYQDCFCTTVNRDFYTPLGTERSIADDCNLLGFSKEQADAITAGAIAAGVTKVALNYNAMTASGVANEEAAV